MQKVTVTDLSAAIHWLRMHQPTEETMPYHRSLQAVADRLLREANRRQKAKVKRQIS